MRCHYRKHEIMDVKILTKKHENFSKPLKEEFISRGLSASSIVPDMFSNINIMDADLVILKSKTKSILRIAAVAWGQGMAVIPDPHTALVIRDRCLTLSFLAQKGLLTPARSVGNPKLLGQTLPESFFPAIQKPLMSSGSVGIKIYETLEEFRDSFSTEMKDKVDVPLHYEIENHPNGLYYLEKLIEGEHYLSYFIGDKVKVHKKKPFASEKGVSAEVVDAPNVEKLTLAYKKATGLLLGDLDLVIPYEKPDDIVIVDPGSFPSFMPWPEAPKLVADEILGWYSKARNIPRTIGYWRRVEKIDYSSALG